MHQYTASDIAKVSAVSLLELLTEDVVETNNPLERLALKKITDLDNKKLASKAILAAMSGRTQLPVFDLKPDIEWLKALGFECINATKRTSYQAWLSDSIDVDSRELLLRADALLNALPSTRDIPNFGFHHRNPLMSMLESMWRDGKLKSDQDIDLIMSAINSGRQNLGVEHFSAMQILLILFLRIKANQEECNEVSWLNSSIPDQLQSCLLVTWRNSTGDLGTEISFNAKTVKWYSTYYLDVFSCLNEHLEVAAHAGKFEIDVDMGFRVGEWFIYRSEFMERCTACSPLLLIDELKRRGFDAEILMWESESAFYQSIPNLSSPVEDDDHNGYLLRIKWSNIFN